jgi:hypothetical protein
MFVFLSPITAKIQFLARVSRPSATSNSPTKQVAANRLTRFQPGQLLFPLSPLPAGIKFKGLFQRHFFPAQ